MQNAECRMQNAELVGDGALDVPNAELVGDGASTSHENENDA